jgi:hypothetical protein
MVSQVLVQAKAAFDSANLVALCEYEEQASFSLLDIESIMDAEMIQSDTELEMESIRTI